MTENRIKAHPILIDDSVADIPFYWQDQTLPGKGRRNDFLRPYGKWHHHIWAPPQTITHHRGFFAPTGSALNAW